jgi:hypothetical protein
MKKTVVLLIFALLGSLMVSAQSKSDKMYDVFDGKDGVFNLSFSKNMIDAIDIDLGEDDDKNVTGDLHQIRFMSYNPKKGSLSGSQFTEKAINLLPSQYKKYVDEDDENSDAIIYLLGKKKKFSECHVFITNEYDDQMRFVVSFFGDFTVNDIDGLKQTGRGMSDD